MHVSEPRLAALSAQLISLGVDLYLQPMGDEFQGEYTPDCAARLPFLTGFTGSAGLGVFWAQAHGARRHTLFVDGRYTLQAAQQAGPRMAVLHSGEVTLAQWLEQQADKALVVGFDPWLMTQAQVEHLQQATAHLSIRWQALEKNPVDAVWVERPAAPEGAVELQPLELAGASYEQKRSALLERIGQQGADGLILALPDGINWLLNIRGSDIPFNPLLLSYFALNRHGIATLFTYERTFGQQVDNYLAEQGVAVASIAALWSGKKSIGAAGESWLIDAGTAASGFFALAEKNGVALKRIEDPTLLPKACKNQVELDGVRAAHGRDGVALSRLLCWLDGRVRGGNFPDELEVVEKLEGYRRQSNLYRQPSFATISGSGPHGAIVHYRADEASNRRLKKGDIFLLDSGGQYPDGTTDVTRTVTIGEPTTQMKEHYTRVLKGHIALAAARFPAGTSGQQLDALARQFLWAAGLDYDHGTGHGVGAYLCVHEGPQRIAKKGSSVALVPGMIVSNEPGFYLEGKYGIRIENLVAVVKLGATAQGKDMLGFETLTLAPIDTRLVEVSLLTVDERNWLNDYHRRVHKALSPSMDAVELRWLDEATRAI